MNIHPIEDGDVEGIVALWQSCELIAPWNDPLADIARARAAPQAEIFVGREGEQVVATVMAGHDGHRGWLYYVGVAPDRRHDGLGGQIVRHAEAWLKSLGVVKIDLMIRAGNPVAAFYKTLGYETEPRTVMARWLVEPPVRDTDPELDVTITWLEMHAPPSRPPARLPQMTDKVALLRAERPSLAFYRYLYNAVGEPWRWYERNAMRDDKLEAIVTDDQVEIYVPYVGGVPAGYAELDFRQMPNVELAYFGLIPAFIGRGLGRWLLDWAIDTAWSRNPSRLWVNTCTLDHPTALSVYQKAGFTPYDQRTIRIKDPWSGEH